jgi:hypothetical protein
VLVLRLVLVLELRLVLRLVLVLVLVLVLRLTPPSAARHCRCWHLRAIRPKR